jgi:uncharacterized protein involved in exopolysaccharide biosynthesis
MDFATIDRSLETGLWTGLALVWRHKFLFTLSAVILFTALMSIVLGLQPRYEGSTLLLARQNPLTVGATMDGRPAGTLPEAAQSTFVQIANSDDVLRNAAKAVGLDRLMTSPPPVAAGLFLRLRSWLFNVPLPRAVGLSAVDASLPRLRAALSVRAEPNTDIIQISYKSSDPVVASAFANAVAHGLIDRQIAVYARPGVAAFFEQQKQRFDQEYQKASDDLAKFSIATNMYSLDDQRKLLLNRISELRSALNATHNLVAQRTAQRETLGEELRHIAPVARSPWVSSLVDKLAGTSANGPLPGSVPLSDPPLLLVRVYQDSMADLFKINADIAGAHATDAAQLTELASATQDLNALAKNALEYAQLQRKVTEASLNADTYARRMVDQEISDASNAAKFSALTVVQPATVPLRPVFPNYILAGAAAVVVSLLGAFGLVFLRSLVPPRRGLWAA